jgi:pyrroloquinoline quinone (PQQ) biosynthesis protein C
MSFSSRLIEITDTSRMAMESMSAMQEMLQGRLTREGYARFLMGLYPIVSNFCPMMAAAAGRCSDRLPAVRNYLYDHIKEEQGHEQMVLDDLAALDVDPHPIPSRRPFPPVQALLGFNYHAIASEGPCGVLGMVYVLEIASSVYGAKVAQSTSRNLSLPLSQGFTFLDSHAELDEDHMGELRKLFQSMEQADLQDTVLNSVQMNFYLFRDFVAYTSESRS